MKKSHPNLLAWSVILSFVVILFLASRVYGIGVELPSLTPSSTNLLAVFFTGLFVGGLTCLAVQGGLLAATIAQKEEENLKENMTKRDRIMPIFSFLTAKLVAYTVLGFLLGSLGSVLELSLTTRIIMQAAVVIFMIGTALNLLNVHPIFRYFVIQPPKFLYRIVRSQSKSRQVFAPVLLGTFTVFIPCGTTQAMMALAIGSGEPILGALIMGAFTLGTSPLFFVLGYLATRLSEALHAKFMKFASIAIILLAVYNLNGVLALTGSPITFDSLWNRPVKAIETEALSEVTINIEETRYTPAYFTVKKDSLITLNLVNTTGRGCTQAFTIPQLGIQRVIPLGYSDIIKFTTPKKTGVIAFMCGMGMYKGYINVI